MDCFFALFSFLLGMVAKAQSSIDNSNLRGAVVVGMDVIQGTIVARISVPVVPFVETLCCLNGAYMYVLTARAERTFSAYIATAAQAAELGMPMTKTTTHTCQHVDVGYDGMHGVVWYDLDHEAVREAAHEAESEAEYQRTRPETQAESDAADRADIRYQQRLMDAAEW